MGRRDKSSVLGEFELGSGLTYVGQLTLDRSKSRLDLYSKERFVPSQPESYIRGTLNDCTKVSLFNCVRLRVGDRRRSDDISYDATLFPHFVLRGDRHLGPDERLVEKADFSIDDAATLFYDFDAFGTVLDARDFIGELVNANAKKLNRSIVPGEYPHICYFTGKSQILSVETKMGVVTAYHAPNWPFSGPNGVAINNQIRIAVKFPSPIEFDVAVGIVYVLRNYFGFLIGRPQRITGFRVECGGDAVDPVWLDTYWSWSPTRRKDASVEAPHPADVLVDPIKRPDEFSNVMQRWIERQPTWRDSRWRFFDAFAEWRRYSVDRLIRSANMFDILPASAVPATQELSDEIQAAKKAALRLFRGLPLTPERDSVLAALGRVGKSSLKRKVRFRAEFLLSRLPRRFPQLTTVTDHAIDCRNYFVHGGDQRLDYASSPNLMHFFTDTLEFVFGVSDLIEAGWDFEEWIGRTSVSHPFGSYCDSYSQRVSLLLNAIRDDRLSRL
jgi:hypothetical protein